MDKKKTYRWKRDKADKRAGKCERFDPSDPTTLAWLRSGFIEEIVEPPDEAEIPPVVDPLLRAVEGPPSTRAIRRGATRRK